MTRGLHENSRQGTQCVFSITEYTKRDLKNLLSDERFWIQSRLPITKRRVISQVSNPRGDDKDMVLITAFNNGQLVAYLGILPDLLRSDRQAPVKFGWLTTWWADKDRGGAAAALILFAAMKKYSNRIAISNFSPDAKRVIDATRRFQEFARFDLSYFIMASPPSWRVLSPLTKWLAAAKNRMIFSRKLQRFGLEVRTVDSSNEALESFIKTWAVEDPLAWDTLDLDWILQFPWVSASAEDEAIQERYEFSVFAKDFRQIPMVVSRHSTFIAFLFLTLSDGRLCLKYAHYDPADIADVVAALQIAIMEVNPWLFVSADTALNIALKRNFPFYLATRSKTSVAYAAKAFPLSVGSRPQFGIGDTIFT
jgi:hypothetical protein